MTKININGWQKQKEDSRDYGTKNEIVFKFYPKIEVLPSKIDLRPMCSPVMDQGPYGTCTQNALSSLVDFYQKKTNGQYLNLSRAFGYWYSRLLDGNSTKLDTGATIRSTMKALAQYGNLPELKWTYTKTHLFTTKPSIETQKIALNYQALKYVLLDQPGMSNIEVLLSFKKALVNELPIEAGFIVYSNYSSGNKTGEIPYPSSKESRIGGHAILLVGYDDSKIITNSINNMSTTGAFIFKNSWGTTWGLQGYGYIPYDYILKPIGGQRLMADGWNLLSEEWVKSN